MSKLIKRRLQNESGAALVEYTPILALFLLIALPSVQLTGVNLSKRFCEVEAGVGRSIQNSYGANYQEVTWAGTSTSICGYMPISLLTGPIQSGLV